MFKFAQTFIEEEGGATAIEYGLIAALVSVAAIGALSATGGSLADIFTTVSSAIQTSTSAT